MQGDIQREANLLCVHDKRAPNQVEILDVA